jgi:hypothetical protein
MTMQRNEFTGRTPQEAKRRALSFWYQNHDRLDLSLAQFFAACRSVSAPEQTTIVFTRVECASGRSAA